MLLALSVAGSAMAATISGMVGDAESGEPLAYATVQVIGETVRGGKINRGAMCGLDGEFVLPGVPVGRYILRCSRIHIALFQRHNSCLTGIIKLNIRL